MKMNLLGKHFMPGRKHLWISMPFFFMIQKCFRWDIPLLDFWWHLKMGEIILTEGSIPRTDLFSHTAHGKIFILQNWLSEIFFQWIYRAGGFELLLFFNALIFLLVLIIIFRLSHKQSQSLWASVIAALVVAICIASNLRPQIFSFLFFAFFYWMMTNHYMDGGKRIYWLPVLMVVWVNLHGAFILGLGLVGIYLFVEIIHCRIYWVCAINRGRTRLFDLGIVFVLTALATLANPEGYSVYGYIYTVVNDPSSLIFVTEWQPPVITGMAGILMFYLPFFLTVMALILSRNKPRLIELVLFLTFAIFALGAVRNCAWFLMIAAPIFARHLSSVPWSSCKMLWRYNPKWASWFAVSAESTRLRKINVGVVGLLVFLLVIRSPWWRSQLLGESLLDAQTPVAAMEYLDANKIEGNIYHSQIYGDYLLWRLWPRQRVFFDGRVHLYGEEFVSNYFRIMEDCDWEKRMLAYDIRYILLAKEERAKDEKGLIGRVRRAAGWRLIYEDDKSIMWKKIIA